MTARGKPPPGPGEGEEGGWKKGRWWELNHSRPKGLVGFDCSSFRPLPPRREPESLVVPIYGGVPWWAEGSAHSVEELVWLWAGGYMIYRRVWVPEMRFTFRREQTVMCPLDMDRMPLSPPVQQHGWTRFQRRQARTPTTTTTTTSSWIRGGTPAPTGCLASRRAGPAR